MDEREDQESVKRTWTWERTDPNRSGSSGDLAKIFRHEEPKRPGVMAVDAPPAAATLLAREVIQNSWDAARELHARDSMAPQFMIEFRFEELVGAAKRSFVESFDMPGLAMRLDMVEKGRSHLGLRPSDCLDEIAATDRPLRILKIVEHATTGMYGSWRDARSHMYWALVSIGYTEKASGSGGSYGYGKAGLISGSRVRSVCAYSCFRAQPDEPSVTRRLLGMTYWGQHDAVGSNHTGFARFGHMLEDDGSMVVPFENEVADEIAGSLGLVPRDPNEVEQLGTTFVVVDPTVDPQGLVRAIERSWWPALIEGDFVVKVVAYDGSHHAPRPKRDPVLKTFIDAWEIANERSEANREREYFAALTANAAHAPPDVPKGRELGRLALVSNLEDWSYADQRVTKDSDVVNHRSLVALTRGPRMVVEYFEAGQAPPFVRGVFVADDAEVGGSRSVDDFLRQTEPKAHDAWQSRNADGDIDPGAAAIAGDVTATIRRRLNAFRAKLKPAIPKAEDVLLPFFNEAMRQVIRGDAKGVPLPTAEVKPISIVPHAEPEVAGDSVIRVRGAVTFTLTEHASESKQLVDLTVAYRYVEDDRIGDHAKLQFDLSGAPGFEQTRGGTFRGTLERDEPIQIAFVTEPYAPDWSGRLIVDGDFVDDEAKAEAAR
jgi:hypothetical protein